MADKKAATDKVKASPCCSCNGPNAKYKSCKCVKQEGYVRIVFPQDMAAAPIWAHRTPLCQFICIQTREPMLAQVSVLLQMDLPRHHKSIIFTITTASWIKFIAIFISRSSIWITAPNGAFPISFPAVAVYKVTSCPCTVSYGDISSWKYQWHTAIFWEDVFFLLHLEWVNQWGTMHSII